MNRKKLILAIIVLAQFCCTSLWFAGNGVIHDLISVYNLDQNAVGHLTSAVQFGFISGTLLFAILTIADRYSPSKVFFCSAVFAAAFNIGMLWSENTLFSLIVFRYLIGFFLAGIYPVGMKIAADHFDKDLGKSLGLLVGALVLGTAFPHFLGSLDGSLNWKLVIITTSALSIVGGTSMLLIVPNGPFRKASQSLDFSVFFGVFKNVNFRSSAIGYFGHMWELYAFWAFVPFIMTAYANLHQGQNQNVSLWSFAIIAIGGPACVIGAKIAEFAGTKYTASLFLTISMICCVVSPIVFIYAPATLFLVFMMFWGMVIIADSPLFSTLVAQNAESKSKGSALTIVNCIGFSITIISIQLLNVIKEMNDPKYLFVILAIGPALGLVGLKTQKEG